MADEEHADYRQILLADINDEIEIIIEDGVVDLSEEEISALFDEDFQLDELPNPMNDDVNKRTQQQQPKKFTCGKCNTKYVKEFYYKTHIEKCNVGNQVDILPQKELLSTELQDDLKRKSPTMITDCLMEAVNNAIFKIAVKGMKTPGNYALELAKEICDNIDPKSDSILNFSDCLYTVLLPALQMKSHHAEMREKQCTMLHRCFKNEILAHSWLRVVYDMNSNVGGSSVLFNFVVKQWFEKALQWRNEVTLNKTEKEIDIKLSHEEQKTLRYVAGFIPFSLKKRYQHQKNSEVAETVLSVIKTWEANPNDDLEEYSFLEFTKTWTERINRGGIFLVNDEFFIFIRRIENTARTVLNINLIKEYRGEDLRDVLMEKFKKSELIDLSWESLSKGIESDKIKAMLKDIILRKWISIRAKSFVNCWIRLFKRKKNSVSGIVFLRCQKNTIIITWTRRKKNC